MEKHGKNLSTRGTRGAGSANNGARPNGDQPRDFREPSFEVGSLVLVRRDPYGVSYLGWTFEGHKGKVTKTTPGRTEPIYYVRLEGEDFELPFRESDLLGFDEGGVETD